MKEISIENLEEMERGFDGNKMARLAMNAVVSSGIDKAALNYDAKRRMHYEFSVDIEAGKLTDQKQSGRCWMFAALNTMRLQIMNDHNIENFELSQSYPLFYDKLEKANYFLENILSTLDEPTDGRLIAWLLQGPVEDGGQWDMFKSLVEKYGVVPQYAMPESFHSSNTRNLTKFLTLKLREFACRLREQYATGTSADSLRTQKAAMMDEIYTMLCVCLGKPPKRVRLQARDKDKKLVVGDEMSPVEFYKAYVGWNLDDYISLINAPTADKPYGKTFTVKMLGNVYGGKPIKYLNLDISELKKAAIAQMQAGEVVWFGCDVGQWLNRDWGAMDIDAFDYPLVLGTGFNMTKAQRLDYGESLMTHAMVFTGVDLDDAGKPLRWKVENSWGEKSGNKGWYIMSDAWFDEFMYQVVVHKKHLGEDLVKLYEQEPLILQPWDPMGSLA